MNFWGHAWHGILPQAVVKVGGKTAIHETCLKALDHLSNVTGSAYVNATRAQRLVLFTDGREEKQPNIPIHDTVAFLKKHRDKMERLGDLAFDFEKYFILGGGQEQSQQDWTGELKAQGFDGEKTMPRDIVYVVIQAATAPLKGRAQEPDEPGRPVPVTLAPRLRFGASQAQPPPGVPPPAPLAGEVVFRVEHAIKDLTVAVSPDRALLTSLNRDLEFQLTLQGRALDALFLEGTPTLTGLRLEWEFIAVRTARDGKATRRPEGFFGLDPQPITIELVAANRDVPLRCIEPVGVALNSGTVVPLPKASRTGIVARVEADFAKLRSPAALRVTGASAGSAGGLHVEGGPDGSAILTNDPARPSARQFAIIASAPPGTSEAAVDLRVMTAAGRGSPVPAAFGFRAQFQPATIGYQWLANPANTAAGTPASIEFDGVIMMDSAAGIPMVSSEPRTNLVRFNLPEGAVQPAAECRIEGEHRHAFRLTPRGDGSGEYAGVLDRNWVLAVEPNQVYVPGLKKSVETNFLAELVIEKRANFVFAPEGAEEPAPVVDGVRIPLRMRAILQAGE
jgi:hypothetical protein